MPRNLAILLFDDAEVLDFCGPYEVFSVASSQNEQPTFNVFTVAEKTQVTARNGLSVNPDYTLNTCPNPDILLVPGGIGSRTQINNGPLIDWIKQAAHEAELVLSVCTGALLLGKAGLLDALDTTTHHVAYELLREMVPSCTVHEDQRFVDTGKIVTSAGIAAGIDMSLHVVERLLGTEAAAKTARQMEYPWKSNDGNASVATSFSGEIRAMTGNDARLVSELAIRSKAHWDYTDEQMAVFRDELTLTPEDLESRIAFGIENDSGVVGFYTILRDGAGSAELEHIFVDPDHLYQGLGTKLLHHAMSHCQALGIREIVVLSDPNASGFYERNGARLIKHVPSSIPGRSLPQFQFDISAT